MSWPLVAGDWIRRRLSCDASETGKWSASELADWLFSIGNTRSDGIANSCLASCHASLSAAGLSAVGNSEARLLEVTSEEEVSEEADFETTLCCEHCGSESVRLTHEHEKHPGSKILHRDSQDSPRWYQESQELDDIRFWDGAMGEGFSEWYAWYLKEGIESAGESPDTDSMRETAKTAAETVTRQLQLF